MQINVGLDVYVPAMVGEQTLEDQAVGEVLSSLGGNNQLRLWTHDNFGEDLLLNVRAGSIYYWDKTNGTNNRAVALTDLAELT